MLLPAESRWVQMGDDMTEQRPAKKSESVEVRLPYEAKLAFIAACKADQRTASEVIREAIDAYVDNRDKPAAPAAEAAAPDNLVTLVPRPLRKKRYLIAGAAGVMGLAALAALPSVAAPNTASEKAAAFAKFDRNGDGVVTYQEFVAK